MNRVYAARLAGMVVLGPDGESIGRVRDVVISISSVRQQPRVLGLVVELLTRRRIFVPILRVTAIEPNAVTLTTANVSLRRFAQRPGEVLVLGQVLDTRVRVTDPELENLAGVDVVVADLAIEQVRSRDWMVTRIAVRSHRRLGRRTTVHVVDWQHVAGLTPSALSLPGQGVAQLLQQFEGQRPIEVADAIRELPAKRRYEVVNALDDERLADILQELPRASRPSSSNSSTPSAPPTCSRRWIPTMPPTCSASSVRRAPRCCWPGWTPRTPSRFADSSSTPPTLRAV